MKISIFSKILSLLLILTIVPLIILILFIVNDFKTMENASVQTLEDGTAMVVDNSTKSLNDLGATIVKNQAIAAKRLVELYLQTHPDKTAEQLIADPEFQAIGIQPVGEKGYTTVIQTKNQNMIAHPNKAMMGKNLLSMKDQPEMKDWWRIVEVTWRDNVDNSGYYQWPEADGTYSDKYMYIAVIDTKLQGDIDLSIAATTYINEFNAPTEMLVKQMEETKKTMSGNIGATTRNLRNKTFILILAALLIVFISGLFFTSSITKPIEKLKIFSKEIGGNKGAKLDITSNDEFSELGKCFNRMAKDIETYHSKLEKNNNELEKRVDERTKELLQKNEELEKFNKMVVDREIKMVELKKQIAKLEANKKN